MNSTNPLSQLVGHELAAVIFIRDYIQLDFDGPLMTVINTPSIEVGNTSMRFGQDGFADGLISNIGATVTSATLEEGHCARLEFAKGCTIVIPLDDDSYQFGPEAIVFRDEDRGTWIW